MSFAFAIFLLQLVYNFGNLLGVFPLKGGKKTLPKFDYCQTQAQIILQNSVGEFWNVICTQEFNLLLGCRIKDLME